MGGDGRLAIASGALAGNSLFFGTSTSETTSAPIQIGSWSGGWNSDYAPSVYTSAPWWLAGNDSNRGVGAGVFALSYFSGAGNNGENSHRTILLGY
ncbi:hypothetical protein FWG76_02535 [Candidatus Saccharibacteria bacterium]|nr:hypothetical protein [Candidatus Saccharibacteria bacterium]